LERERRRKLQGKTIAEDVDEDEDKNLLSWISKSRKAANSNAKKMQELAAARKERELREQDKQYTACN
jgi:hypothetical protein